MHIVDTAASCRSTDDQCKPLPVRLHIGSHLCCTSALCKLLEALHAAQPTGLHGSGTMILESMDWMSGTVLWTVSAQLDDR